MVNGYILSCPFDSLEVDTPRILPLADGAPVPTHPEDVKDLITKARLDPFYCGKPTLHFSVQWIREKGRMAACVRSKYLIQLSGNELIPDQLTATSTYLKPFTLR